MIPKLSHQLATVYLIFGLQYVYTYTYTYTTRHVHRDTDLQLLVVHTANVFVFIFVLVQLYMYTLFTEIDDTSTRTCIIVISRRGTDPSCVSRSACRLPPVHFHGRELESRARGHAELEKRRDRRGGRLARGGWGSRPRPRPRRGPRTVGVESSRRARSRASSARALSLIHI